MTARSIPSLPFMGRDDGEAVRVGKSDAARSVTRVPHPARLRLAVPPHEGEGGF
jgi:hypothetical protein